MKRIICALLSFVLFFTLFPFTYAVAETTSFEDDPKAIQTASNSVIMLSCYDKEGNLYATGSAFAAFEEGVFVTNCHVIEKEVYAIRAQMETGLEFSINSVVAYDVDKDIAILRTEAKTGLAPLPIGSTAALERGEKVIAIGSPLGLINTLSIGLYSGTIKDDRVYLQFSAAISHGSSGGALFNNRGEVVGITAASFTEGQNLNLAIPIEDVVELWEKRDKAEELSIADFYNEWDHFPFYSVSYILSHASEFQGNNNQTILTEGYIVVLPSASSAKSNRFFLVGSIADYNVINSTIEDLYAAGGIITDNERENFKNYGIKSKTYDSRLNIQTKLNNMLGKAAICVVSDNAIASHGDFIRIQADIYVSTLRNPIIIQD